MLLKTKIRIPIVITIAIVSISIALTGCGQQSTNSSTPTPNANTSVVGTIKTATLPLKYTDLAGTWKNYSARLYYDAGGGGAASTVPEMLGLTNEGKWTFGKSSGSFSVSAIDSTDWTRWGVASYGPTRKITFSNWNGSTADGPIEESNGQVDFVWVIYKESPPTVSAPGTMWLKFGH